jgi:hypothetical protein
MLTAEHLYRRFFTHFEDVQAYNGYSIYISEWEVKFIAINILRHAFSMKHMSLIHFFFAVRSSECPRPFAHGLIIVFYHMSDVHVRYA